MQYEANYEFFNIRVQSVHLELSRCFKHENVEIPHGFKSCTKSRGS